MSPRLFPCFKLGIFSQVFIVGTRPKPRMANPFFDHPILNSPYACPSRHWKLDENGQPTQEILDDRRQAAYITSIPKPRKQKGVPAQDGHLVFDEGKGLSTAEQMYDPIPVINQIRSHVDAWRHIPNPANWKVSPETARFLQHWRKGAHRKNRYHQLSRLYAQGKNEPDERYPRPFAGS